MGAKPRVIAIDGPAASGKNAVGQLLAERLGYRLVDTGAMYRAVTWAALRWGVAVTDEAALGALARSTTITIEPQKARDGRPYTVLIDGEEVGPELWGAAVEATVSQVAAVAGVREVLVAQQRQLAQEGSVVMIGRDIGTVVLSEAPLKIYLRASLEERARRRQEELRHRGQRQDYTKVLAEMQRRDALDSGRAHSPLRPAADAHLIDTDGLTIDQVVARILALTGCP